MSVYANDRPEWFDRAMHSIWDEQSLKPDEIVLVQDGTIPIELSDVIDKWKVKLGEQLVLIVHSKNLGLTKSLNKGIEQVKSQYIARMDSDDISCPDRFEKQVKFLESHPDIAVLGGSIELIDESEQVTNLRHYPQTPADVEKTIFFASPLPHPAVMIRKQVFDAGLRYNEKYKRNQDIALWFDVLAHGFKIASLPDITMKYRFLTNVYNRRWESNWNECKIYAYGIYRMKGIFSLLYIYPVLRYLFRLLPVSLVHRIYHSGIYKNFFRPKKTYTEENN